MGTLNISRDILLPVWVVRAGAALLLLMMASLIVCVLRDIAEMRVLWAMAEAADKRTGRQRKVKKDTRPLRKAPPRRCHHGVCLLETDLRYQAYRRRPLERKAE